MLSIEEIDPPSEVAAPPEAQTPQLENVVIAVCDNNHSEYALDWSIGHFVTPSVHKVTLISVAEELPGSGAQHLTPIQAREGLEKHLLL
jgi:hypothetical protein